jgi:hypothetical protein
MQRHHTPPEAETANTAKSAFGVVPLPFLPAPGRSFTLMYLVDRFLRHDNKSCVYAPGCGPGPVCLLDFASTWTALYLALEFITLNNSNKSTKIQTLRNGLSLRLSALMQEDWLCRHK